MASIHRLSNAKLYVYADDHPPPHFHVRGPDSNAQIRIDDLQVMRGDIHPSDYAEALEWVEANKDLVVRKWRELNERD